MLIPSVEIKYRRDLNNTRTDSPIATARRIEKKNGNVSKGLITLALIQKEIRASNKTIRAALK
jgi:hypothetical protein